MLPVSISLAQQCRFSTQIYPVRTGIDTHLRTHRLQNTYIPVDNIFMDVRQYGTGSTRVHVRGRVYACIVIIGLEYTRVRKLSIHVCMAVPVLQYSMVLNIPVLEYWPGWLGFHAWPWPVNNFILQYFCCMTEKIKKLQLKKCYG